jgi:hypothetical protein
VRFQPDDWPPYAEEAWTTRELASESPRLRTLTVDSDRVLLSVDEPPVRREA